MLKQRGSESGKETVMSRGMDGPEKSEAKAEDKGEPEEAAAEIEAGGRRKEIAEHIEVSTEKSRPFLILMARTGANCPCLFSRNLI